MYMICTAFTSCISFILSALLSGWVTTKSIIITHFGNKRKVWWLDFHGDSVEFHLHLAVVLQADGELQLSERVQGEHFDGTHHTPIHQFIQPPPAVQPSLSPCLIWVLSEGQPAAVWATCKSALVKPQKVSKDRWFQESCRRRKPKTSKYEEQIWCSFSFGGEFLWQELQHQGFCTI